MDADNYLIFLEKFAAGQHSEQEHRAFQEWLLGAPPEQVQAALDRYAELQRYHLSLPPPPAAIAALEAQLDNLAVPSTLFKAAPRWRRQLAVAAVWLLLVAGGAYVLRTGRLQPTIAYKQQRTDLTHTSRLTLADGSVVHLNGNSSLSYPATFSGETREVYLQGEAYFQVAKDRARPFIVHSGRLQTRVVGTSFNVYAYPLAPRLEVTVLAGQVLVSDSVNGKTVALHPAQKGVFVFTAAILRREPAPNPQLSLAWQQGKLRFEQASLEEITDKLALRYGVRITLRSAQLRQCRLTVEFGRESLTTALEVLTALTGSTYTQHQQHITLTGSGC